MEIGIEKGEVMGRIHYCQELLKTTPTPNDQLAAMPLKELRALAEELKKQASQGK